MVDCRASTREDPLDRMVEVTRWFLSSLSASRKVVAEIVGGEYR